MSAKRASVWIALATAGALLTACGGSLVETAPDAWRTGTTSDHSIKAGGDDRGYTIHIPALRPRTKLRIPSRYPLVVLLHGSGADAETIRRQTNFDSLSELYRVVAVYPEGSSGLFGYGSDWNAGECCGAAARQDVDDVKFIKRVIADVAGHIPIDPHRIYIGGFSDGGRMAFHFACASAATVAAIGVVSGSLEDAHCAPSAPVALVEIHGTADADIPYRHPSLTAAPESPDRDLSSLPPSFRFWAAVNRCKGVIARAVTPKVTRTLFRSCAGADATMYTIIGGTHSWPGGRKDGSDGDNPEPGLDASRTLMRFFLAHAR